MPMINVDWDSDKLYIYIFFFIYIYIYINSETIPLRSQLPQHANAPHQTKSTKCIVATIHPANLVRRGTPKQLQPQQNRPTAYQSSLYF